VWLVVASLLALAWVPTPAEAGKQAPAGFSCLDLNHDGACVAGQDTDITDTLVTAGYVTTAEDIVVPANARKVLRKGTLSLLTSGNVTVAGRLQAAAILVSAGGTLVITDTAVLQGKEYVDLSASGDVTIGSATVLAGAGMTNVSSWDGTIQIEGAVIGTRDGVDVQSYGNTVTVMAGSKLSAERGTVRLYGNGDVLVNGSLLVGNGHMVWTDAHLVDFQGNVVKVTGPDGWVYMYTAGSTINLTGTQFKGNLDPVNMTLEAENVIQ
jgi:hypothetical protein